jgi:hypothetical protein
MPHLLRNGHPAHEFTLEDCSRGGRAKAAKYADQVKERRRRRRRVRYLAERARRGENWRATYGSAREALPPDPDSRLCPRCGGVQSGLLAPQDRLCSCTGWERLGYRFP